MPAIDAISASGGPPTASSALGNLDSEAFLKLLVAQLRYQNPMSPSDPSTMLQQTAQFTQVESLQRVAEAQQALLGLSHANTASSLIGKEISARTDGGGELHGLVEAVRFTSEGPVLLVGDWEVPLTAATEIRRPAGDPAPDST